MKDGMKNSYVQNKDVLNERFMGAKLEWKILGWKTRYIEWKIPLYKMYIYLY